MVQLSRNVLSSRPSAALLSRCSRRPLDCDPEAVLLKAGLEARSVAAFLHENALEFIAEDGIQSAADALVYLSDAGMARDPWSCSAQTPYRGLL